MNLRIVFAAMMLGTPISVSAYELATHGAVTQKAYDRSVLVKEPQLLKDLGITDRVDDLGDVYYDITTSDARPREAQTFEGNIIEGTLKAKPLSVQGWLLRGAIREDDVPWPFGDNPQDDPVNDFRVRHHFYDPVFHRALSVNGAELGEKAPTWASGYLDAFANPLTEHVIRGNHFTILDAREALYRALTGKNKEGQSIAPTKEERNKYWATAFRALGDVVHMVEDMAQPQHTRNDPHAGTKFDETGGPFGLYGHKSVYESYIEARATGGAFTTVGYASLPKPISVSPPPLDYLGDPQAYPTGYPIPRFTDYLSFFTTRHKGHDIPARQGLADYSNRGFFSAGTNLGSQRNAYDLPLKDPAAYLPKELGSDPWLNVPIGNDPNAKVQLLQAGVFDALPGGQDAGLVPLTTYGRLEYRLVAQGRIRTEQPAAPNHTRSLA